MEAVGEKTEATTDFFFDLAVSALGNALGLVLSWPSRTKVTPYPVSSAPRAPLIPSLPTISTT